MKRLFCAVLALCLLGITAFADIAWEPENSFYQRNSRKCEPEERTYWINGSEGYVTVREEPEGKPLANLKNGFLLHVYGTYENDGVRWGLVSVSASHDQTEMFLAAADEVKERWVEAWVPMVDMVLYYDQQCFREDHAGEILEQERTVQWADKAVCFYEYPGGPLDWQMEKLHMRDAQPVTLHEGYVDEEGRTWGYIGYWQGSRNRWICLDDLENPDLRWEDHTPELIPAAGSSAETTQTESTLEDISSAEGTAGTTLPAWTAPPDYTVLFAAVGVLAVCGVTAMLLIRMKKKKE